MVIHCIGRYRRGRRGFRAHSVVRNAAQNRTVRNGRRPVESSKMKYNFRAGPMYLQADQHVLYKPTISLWNPHGKRETHPWIHIAMWIFKEYVSQSQASAYISCPLLLLRFQPYKEPLHREPSNNLENYNILDSTWVRFEDILCT